MQEVKLPSKILRAVMSCCKCEIAQCCGPHGIKVTNFRLAAIGLLQFQGLSKHPVQKMLETLCLMESMVWVLATVLCCLTTAPEWLTLTAGKGKVVSKEGPGIFLQGLAVYDRLGVLEKGEPACIDKAALLIFCTALC